MKCVQRNLAFRTLSARTASTQPWADRLLESYLPPASESASVTVKRAALRDGYIPNVVVLPSIRKESRSCLCEIANYLDFVLLSPGVSSALPLFLGWGRSFDGSGFTFGGSAHPQQQHLYRMALTTMMSTPAQAAPNYPRNRSRISSCETTVSRESGGASGGSYQRDHPSAQTSFTANAFLIRAGCALKPAILRVRPSQAILSRFALVLPWAVPSLKTVRYYRQQSRSTIAASWFRY